MSSLTWRIRAESFVFPGQHHTRSGMPSRVTAMPMTIWGRSSRRSLDLPQVRNPVSLPSPAPQRAPATRPTAPNPHPVGPDQAARAGPNKTVLTTRFLGTDRLGFEVKVSRDMQVSPLPINADRSLFLPVEFAPSGAGPAPMLQPGRPRCLRQRQQPAGGRRQLAHSPAALPPAAPVTLASTPGCLTTVRPGDRGCSTTPDVPAQSVQFTGSLRLMVAGPAPPRLAGNARLRCARGRSIRI